MNTSRGGFWPRSVVSHHPSRTRGECLFHSCRQNICIPLPRCNTEPRKGISEHDILPEITTMICNVSRLARVLHGRPPQPAIHLMRQRRDATACASGSCICTCMVCSSLPVFAQLGSRVHLRRQEYRRQLCSGVLLGVELLGCLSPLILAGGGAVKPYCVIACGVACGLRLSCWHRMQLHAYAQHLGVAAPAACLRQEVFLQLIPPNPPRTRACEGWAHRVGPVWAIHSAACARTRRTLVPNPSAQATRNHAVHTPSRCGHPVRPRLDDAGAARPLCGRTVADHDGGCTLSLCIECVRWRCATGERPQSSGSAAPLMDDVGQRVEECALRALHSARAVTSRGLGAPPAAARCCQLCPPPPPSPSPPLPPLGYPNATACSQPLYRVATATSSHRAEPCGDMSTPE